VISFGKLEDIATVRDTPVPLEEEKFHGRIKRFGASVQNLYVLSGTLNDLETNQQDNGELYQNFELVTDGVTDVWIGDHFYVILSTFFMYILTIKKIENIYLSFVGQESHMHVHYKFPTK
jgi:hypothetical protein